jgi:regulator of protease activity HflC (stomatin/prohibitin superfamily)
VQNMAGILSTRVQQLNVSTATKTSDNVTVTLRIAVQYRVINETIIDDKPVEGESVQPDMDRSESERQGVWRAFYRLTDIEQQLIPYVEDVVRSEVPKRNLDEAYASKEAVAAAVKSALAHEMKKYDWKRVIYRPPPLPETHAVST